MRREHRQTLWAHFLTIALGAWLATSPAILGYQSAALAASDIRCGLLVMIFGAFSLSWRMGWARLANGAIGVYLLFAPLLFWAPTAAERSGWKGRCRSPRRRKSQRTRSGIG